MAKKAQAKAKTTFNLGDYVRIKGLAGQVGRVTELRGPLGPGGAPVYRIKVPRKPRVSYIELLGDQLEYLPRPDKIAREKRQKTVPKVSR